MPAIDRGPSLTTIDRPTQAQARRVAAEWPHVRIADVEVVPAADGGEPAALVRACVHLGALAPADVQVELTAAAADTIERHTIPRRMWSMYPYHNDAYDFETRIPLRVLGREEGCAIEVTPSADLPPGMTVAPVIERVPPARVAT